MTIAIALQNPSWRCTSYLGAVIVNGTAYPTVTLEPKAYRLRMLNAANDRFFNFQWYVADPTTASTGLNALGQRLGAAP